MTIDNATLDTISRAYIAPMTSIRGRRIHRLLMREFARFDHVLAAIAEDGTPALLALADDGRAAVCANDGRGAVAEIVAWARLGGASVTTAHDLLKDSLPIVGWSVWHPGFVRVAGALAISAVGVSSTDQARIAAALRRLGE